jgi:hypothetical protein
MYVIQELVLICNVQDNIEEMINEELDCPAVSVPWRAIAEVKQRWSVIGWVTKNLLSRAPPCFGRHVKPLVPATIAVVSSHHGPAWWVMDRSPYV